MSYEITLEEAKKQLSVWEQKREELREMLRGEVEEAKISIEDMKVKLAENYSNEKFDYMWGMMQWVENMKTLC